MMRTKEDELYSTHLQLQGIKYTPTFAFYKKGRKVRRASGMAVH
jgi:hypothetical protein